MLKKELNNLLLDFKINKKYWLTNNLTGDDYDNHRSKPAPYIKKTIEIAKLLNLKNFVEIGSTRFAVTEKCIRFYDEKFHEYVSPPCCCDGHSNFFWVDAGFEVYTVDIDENCKNGVVWSYNNLGREVPKNLNIEIPKDGIEFLSEFKKTIDVLYLDGWDVGTPNYAEKHLEAYNIAKPKLSETHIIVIDDTDYLTESGGKDKLLSPHLIKEDYFLLFNGRQTAFLKHKDF
jgi:hypothetical protein